MDVTFTNQEQELIYQLAEKLTGSCQAGDFRRDVLISNVARRISVLKFATLAHYLNFIKSNKEEFAYLVSALTIHTTSWFREQPHYKKLQEYLLENYGSETCMLEPFKVWCAACSTGEEVYSFALVLEDFKKSHPYFKYRILGTDIDPICLKKAVKGIYSKGNLQNIPDVYYKYLLSGKDRAMNYFTLSPDIKNLCSFKQQDLTKINILKNDKYDLIICRNVLIYFSKNDVDKIVTNFVQQLVPRGLLFLGHSEILEHNKYPLYPQGQSSYIRIYKHQENSIREKKTVLVVDDSAVVRRTLSKLLVDYNYQVLSASSGKEATACLNQNKVDLITLDLRMPQIDGPTWLKMYRAEGKKTPVVIVSEASPSEATDVLGALDNGAQDFCEKNAIQNNPTQLIEKFNQIIDSTNKSKGLQQSKFKSESKLTLSCPDLFLIGASTGGTEALSRLLKNFSPTTPPILVVQHISATFTKPFAERLAKIAGIPLGESIDNTRLEKGKIYLAQNDYHIGISQRGNEFFLRCSNTPPVNNHRPSVDFLFKSAANTSCKVMAILMTGMGKDGAIGMSELYRKGNMTLAQDQDSCVVFGMPKEAIKLGAAKFTGNITEIREQMDLALKNKE